MLFASIGAKYLWLCFIIFAVINFFASLYMVRFLSIIKIRTNMSVTIAGGVLLSIVSSLPEIISAITSGVIGSPQLSLGDVMGANLFSGAMLALADIIFIRHLFFNKINRSNIIIIYIMIFINLILFLTFIPLEQFNFMRITIPYINLSWPFIILVLVYIIFLVATFKGWIKEMPEPKTELPLMFRNWSLTKIITCFVIIVIVLVISSIMLVSVIDNFEAVYNIKKESAAAILLGMTTALPEVVSVFSLYKMQQGNVAIAGIIGSHFFNSTLYFIADVFHYSDGTLSYIQQGNVKNLIAIFILISLLLIITIIFSLKTINFFKKNKSWTLITSSSIVVIYFMNIMLQMFLK